jgi:hypothetical protein
MEQVLELLKSIQDQMRTGGTKIDEMKARQDANHKEMMAKLTAWQVKIDVTVTYNGKIVSQF